MLEAIATYYDVADEHGPRALPVAGGIWDQPAWTWMAWRLIRSARAAETARRIEEAKRRARR